MNKIESPYIRPIFHQLTARLAEPRRYIQVLFGPRQVGKTTLVRQLVDLSDATVYYASAEVPLLNSQAWLMDEWSKARAQADILILDEIQKIEDWSAIVKKCWDEDTFAKRDLKVVLLGSSSWLMQQGLSESLAGRFETLAITHWSFTEMQAAFHYSLEDYIYFGGYPGAANLKQDEMRWRSYMLDSLIETAINRDILLMTRIDKPMLLKKCFEFGCFFPSQEISLQKILGQLQDKGNVTTLSHYLTLLDSVGLLSGIEKYSTKVVSTRSSSPKLQPYNTGLISAIQSIGYQSLFNDPEKLGRYTESTVGAYLLNAVKQTGYSLHYWREGNHEVDFVLSGNQQLIAIEVKSSDQVAHKGLMAFKAKYPHAKLILVGGDEMPLERFLSIKVDAL